MNRKGAIGGNIVMIGVFLTATVFGIQSVLIGDAFAQEISESITDLDRVAQTKSSSGLHFYNYLPMGGSYSTHQMTYKLSRRGGGNDVDWETGNLGSVRADAYLRLQNDTQQYFKNHYGSAPEGLNCDFTEANFTITPFFTSGHVAGIRGYISAGKPVESICYFGGGNVKTSGNKSYGAFFNATDNRYFSLLEEAHDYFRDLESEWGSVSDSYTESRISCGSPPYSDAESAAVSDAEDDIRKGFKTVKSSYPTIPGFNLDSSIKDVGGSFNWGATSDVFEGSSSGSSSTVGCCNYNYCTRADGTTYICGCDVERYEATVTVEPERSEAEYSMEDKKYKIPVEGGWESLVFQVDPYTHDFTND